MLKKIDQFIDCLAKLDLDPFGLNQSLNNNLPLILTGVSLLNHTNEDTHTNSHDNSHDNSHTNSIYT